VIRVYAFHKPKGVLTSTVSERGATPVFDLLPEPYRGFFAVGRLDKDSEGLLLFASDSRFAQRLMDPGAVAKTYLVTVEGFLSEGAMEEIRKGGAALDDRVLRPIEVEREGRAPRGGTRYRVVLHEGLRRQIRRVFAAHGRKVRRLVRIAVGPVALGALAPGEGRELDATEAEALVAATR
jgi:23S rRNA pseudouridine2605 synthase